MEAKGEWGKQFNPLFGAWDIVMGERTLAMGMFEVDADTILAALTAQAEPVMEEIRQDGLSFWLANQEVAVALTPEMDGYFGRAIRYYQEYGRRLTAQADAEALAVAVEALQRIVDMHMLTAAEYEAKWHQRYANAPTIIAREALDRIKGQA